MTSVLFKSPRLVARHHVSRIFAACTQTTAGTAARVFVSRAPRSMRALPLGDTHSSARQASPSALSTVTFPRTRIT